MKSRHTLVLVLLSVAAALLAACDLPSIRADSTPQRTPTISVKATNPTPQPPSPTATPRPEPPIVVTAPIAGQVVRSPVRVSGTASVYEATVLVAVKDASGKVLGRGITTASVGAPLRGNYSADIAFTQPATPQPGTVEVYTESPKDGSVRDLVSIKVTLGGR